MALLATINSWSPAKYVFTACPFMFLSGVALIGTCFLNCFKEVPLLKVFLVVAGLSLMGLSVLVAVYLMVMCFLGGMTVA
jgi:hypothetical protein